MVIEDFDELAWLIDLFDSNSSRVKRKQDQTYNSKVKVYKPDRKIIDFLSDLEVKQFKVSKLIGKHKSLLPVNFNLKALTKKPLSEKACDYILTYFKTKGILK